MNCIEKFGLPLSVAQQIDSRLILNSAHIDDPTIASDIELNSYVLYCLESYQLSQSLVVDYMLEIFRKEFYGWGYTEFSRLNKYIRRVLKETLMTKGIYMGRPGGHVNQRLANLVINEQLPIWDENDFRKYKKIYPTSKTWILLESEFNSLIPQQLTPSIEAKTNPINNQQQQSFIPAPVPVNVTSGLANAFTPPPPNFTPVPPHVTSHPVNALGSTPPICQPTITPGPAHINSVLPPEWPQQAFNASANPYTQIPPIKVPNEMLPATIVAQFVMIWDRNSNYTGKAYDILDDKI